MNDDQIIQETLRELNDWDLKALGTTMWFAQFIQERYKLTERHARRLLDEVYSYGLLHQVRYHEFNLTPLGRWVGDQPDGWIGFKRRRQKEALDQKRQQDYKEQLEIEKSEREIEKLKYEESLREFENNIKKLTKRNLTLQNWQIIYTALGTILGAIGGFALSVLSERWFSLIQSLIEYLW